MDVLKKLVDADGVSGSEEEVKEVIKAELENYVDEIKEDKLGNLIVEKRGKMDGKRLMLAAHMDEVGLIVKYIDDNGFIRFTKVGGIDDSALYNQRVRIKTPSQVYKGVIGVKSKHLGKKDEKTELFVDVGASDRENVAEMGISAGCTITFDRKLVELSNELVTGKALDDRAGCYVLIELLKSLENHRTNIYAVFTVQEEVGLRGAKVAAFRVHPDIAIAIDTTTAGDFPGIKPEECPVKIGLGPCIKIADGRKDSLGGGIITHPAVRRLLIEAAQDGDIPYQIEVLEGGTTDAAAIHMTREGIPSGVVSIPARYLHSSAETLSIKDIKYTISLLEYAIKRIELGM